MKELRLDDGTKGGLEGILKLFADAMTSRTKVVMFSHVVSGLGTRMPARELCAMIRDHGALALVDGAQAVGQMQVDIARIERWDTMLTKRLRDGLARIPSARISSPEDPRLASAITTFRIETIKGSGSLKSVPNFNEPDPLISR